MADLIAFTRRFQLWSYTVSHSELLLRSTKTPEFPTRIDISFKNVALVQLPTLLEGLTLSEGAEAAVMELQIRLDHSRLQGRKVFSVYGSNYVGYIVAGAVNWTEDEGEYYDSSTFVTKPSDQPENER